MVKQSKNSNKIINAKNGNHVIKKQNKKVQEKNKQNSEKQDKKDLCYIADGEEDKIFQKAEDIIKNGQQESFYIVDLQSIRDRYKMWNDLLPQVKMYYAVKANPDNQIVKQLIDLGSYFDCASQSEIKQTLELGCTPDRIVYANPCKTEQHILYAKKRGVKLMTFDCNEEVNRIHKVFPEAELILRIAVVNTDSTYPMGKKFGAPQYSWESILQNCKNLNMKVKGVSFHVGSGGCSFNAYKESLENTKLVFDLVDKMKMEPLSIIDIGGGFSMDSKNPAYNFDKIGSQLNHLFNTYFPGKNSKIQIIGEPGRLICEHAQTIGVKIYMARQQKDCIHYFLNNGVYQAFGCQLFDDVYKGQPLLRKEVLQERIKQSQISYIWGQTCDGCDFLTKNQMFPKMNEEEWIIYRNIGAYSQVLACNFNGYQYPDVYYM